MRQGERTTCPGCGNEVFVQKQRKVFEDFSFGEFHLGCPVCKHDFGAETAEEDDSAAKSARMRLGALLGGETIAPPVSLGDNEKRFCRDCASFIEHPFGARCDRHRREADPMDDCPSFEPRRTRNTQELSKESLL
ncbi:MAG: hypothetical protein PHS41_03440 [Victivallaceae bacterium]|nr:hypothetical protein [Victivallaceae bacterium]